MSGHLPMNRIVHAGSSYVSFSLFGKTAECRVRQDTARTKQVNRQQAWEITERRSNDGNLLPSDDADPPGDEEKDCNTLACRTAWRMPSSGWDAAYFCHAVAQLLLQCM